MKKSTISRLEYWRPINLRIGFAAALAMVILAFSWTTGRPPLEDPYEDFIEIGEVEVIPPTSHPKKEKSPPPPEKISENFIVMPDPVVPFDTFTFEPSPAPLPDPYIGFGEAKKTVVMPTPAPPKEREEKVPPIFKIVEEMPRFPGCEDEGFAKQEKYECAETKLLTYLANNLRYPAIARENGVEGMVVVSFVIETDGSITDVKILRNIGAGCGAEAKRVAENMPDWLPGKQRGREVRVQYNLPVRFRLN